MNDLKTREFMKELDRYFLSEVKISRYRMGKRQELETLINEEAMLFAKYVRSEKQTWNPRIAGLTLDSGDISRIPSSHDRFLLKNRRVKPTYKD